MLLHRLDDDDGVVDDDADRQHQRKQRQRVDRKTERELHGERADERDGNGYDRDDRRPPGLEENQNHEHDERSEEHTSELQSLMRISYAVFCLKKQKKTQTTTKDNITK